MEVRLENLKQKQRRNRIERNTKQIIKGWNKIRRNNSKLEDNLNQRSEKNGIELKNFDQ